MSRPRQQQGQTSCMPALSNWKELAEIRILLAVQLQGCSHNLSPGLSHHSQPGCCDHRRPRHRHRRRHRPSAVEEEEVAVADSVAVRTSAVPW